VVAQPDAAVPLLRRGLLGLGWLTTLGIAIELATERHWTQPIMIVAWAALAAAAVGLLLLRGGTSAGRVRLARLLAVLVIASAALGVGEHVYANFDAGPLDQHYTESWDGLPIATRLWLAVSKTVGPSPPLAPGALAQIGVCILLVSLRHPALAPPRPDVGT
jgi:hypothetical protein